MASQRTTPVQVLHHSAVERGGEVDSNHGALRHRDGMRMFDIAVLNT
jgi:hypothetical protein